MRHVCCTFFALLLLVASHPVHAVIDIVFWHAYEGFILDKFKEIVDDFNHQSTAYRISLVYKGNYTETYDAGVAAFATGQHPHILFVSEVATQTMMLDSHMFKPVDSLMRQYYKKFDPDVYIDAVRDFYSSSMGEMFSLPWNASTGILFYNKKIFEEAGLNPECPPKTWPELEKTGIQLVKSGYQGFVTAWPAAYHLEHQAALHNLPFATLENGYCGLGARLIFNHPYIVRHMQKLAEWQKNGIFSYQGRFSTEPEKAFAEGKCGILMNGANRYPILKKMSKDPIGVGFLPYWPDIVDSPYRLNIGGGSFWVLAGFDDSIYRGIAQFFSFLSQAEVQAYWHQQTGYLPITEAAYYLSKKKGFYKNNPAAEIAVLEVLHRKGTPYTNGIRLGNYPTVRELLIDYLEKVFNGEMTPKEALDAAVAEGNKVLEDFEKAHSAP